MCFSVLADNSRTVNGKCHIELLDSNVMYELVISALQKA